MYIWILTSEYTASLVKNKWNQGADILTSFVIYDLVEIVYQC